MDSTKWSIALSALKAVGYDVRGEVAVPADKMAEKGMLELKLRQADKKTFVVGDHVEFGNKEFAGTGYIKHRLIDLSKYLLKISRYGHKNSSISA